MWDAGAARGPLPAASRLSLPQNSLGEGPGALRAGWFRAGTRVLFGERGFDELPHASSRRAALRGETFLAGGCDVAPEPHGCGGGVSNDASKTPHPTSLS